MSMKNFKNPLASCDIINDKQWIPSLNHYKNATMEMVKEKGWLGPSIEQVWMYFIEEVGELAGSIRRSRNQFRDRKKVKIESELGDVFSYLFQISAMLNIDLDNMWHEHQVKGYKKFYFTKKNSNFRNV